MNVNDLLAVVAILGIGGALGAIATVIGAGARVNEDWEAFRFEFRRYMSGRTDAAAAPVNQAFVALDEELSLFRSAFDKLKRALSRRK